MIQPVDSNVSRSLVPFLFVAEVVPSIPIRLASETVDLFSVFPSYDVASFLTSFSCS